MPSRQSFLKQMRQILNLRYTARGRPHSSHRRSVRLLNFGVRFALAIFDLLATVETLHKGIVSNYICDELPDCIQQCHAVSIRPGRCYDCNIHSLNIMRFVCVNFREHQLFRQTHAEVSAAIE